MSTLSFNYKDYKFAVAFFSLFFFRTEQSDKVTEIMICKSTLDDVKWTSSNGEMQYARHAKQPHE